MTVYGAETTGTGETISNVSFLENLTVFLADHTGNVTFKTSIQEYAGLFFNQDSFNLLILSIFNIKYVKNIT